MKPEAAALDIKRNININKKNEMSNEVIKARNTIEVTNYLVNAAEKVAASAAVAEKSAAAEKAEAVKN